MNPTDASSSQPGPAVIAAAAPVPAKPTLDPVSVFAALGQPVRWRALQLMAEGEVVYPQKLARQMDAHFDTVAKHLRLLLATGAVAARDGEPDTRFTCYYIPEAFRPEPGVVDYGFARLDFRTKR